jgi:cell pole-organizing protein PopZ
MEEILASIRRIIEDSDTVRQPTEEHGAAVAEVSSGEVEAFRAELDEPAPSVMQAPSMADIKASVSHVPEVEIEPASPSTVDIFPLRDEPEAVEPAGDFARHEVAVNEEPEAETFTDAPVYAAEPEQDDPAAEGRPAIISDQTGRQVAAAFGELSEAFAASRRRSFDEMAEEMLRPMLQDWLDNNLPTLVEKLVREEIERVARGN